MYVSRVEVSGGMIACLKFSSSMFFISALVQKCRGRLGLQTTQAADVWPAPSANSVAVSAQCGLRGDFAFQGHNCQVKERKLAQEHIYLLLLGPHAPSLCTVKVFINSIMTLVCLFAFMVGADQKNSKQAGKVQPKKHHLNRVKDKTSSIF